MKQFLLTLVLALSSWQVFALDGYSDDPIELQNSISANENVVLIFSATWCGPCQKMKRNVWSQESYKSFTDGLQVKRFYMDIDLNPGLSQQYQVTSIPTWFMISEGSIKSRTGSAQMQTVMNIVQTHALISPITSPGFIVEEPVIQEPIAQEPIAQEPIAQEPVVQEPAVDYSNSVSLLNDKLQNKEGNLVVIFGATWCGPCKRMKRDVWEVQDFLDFSDSLGTTKFYFDIDQFSSLSTSWGVTSIPTWYVVRDGSILSKNSSASKSQVESILSSSFTQLD